MGLKATMYVLFTVFMMIVIAILLITVLPQISSYLLLFAGIGFIICVILFLISFISNPYRFGSLFKVFF